MGDSEHNQHRFAWVLAGLGTLVFAVVAGFSFRRHLHVDELENIYSIQLCGTFARPEYMLPLDLYEVILAPLTRRLATSLAIFVTLRWLFVACLLGLCAGVALVQRALPSPRGKAAVFLCAVLFGPLYRHGFEVRHDIFVGFALVALYWACERARMHRLTFVVASLAGALAALAQANSFKAFAVCAPALCLCALLSSHGQSKPARAFLFDILRFVPGALGGALLATAILAGSNALRPYFSSIRDYLEFSLHSPYRLSPVPVVSYLVIGSPVHTLLVFFGLLVVVVRVKSGRHLDEGLVPACFLLIMLIAAWLNPTLFPYNLTWMAPSVLWMCALGLSECQRSLDRVRVPIRTCAKVTGVLLGLGCLLSTQGDQYFRKTWDEQLRVEHAAEALTPTNEPVVDLTGLVISRPPPARDWLVHSLLMAGYHSGKRESIAHIIERTWPAVIIGGHYRWGFLDDRDRRIVTQNYIPISRELWVLGLVIGPQSSRISLHRAGRYLVQTSRPEVPLGTIDAHEVSADKVLILASGAHLVESQQSSWRLAWLGPARTLPVASIATPLFESADFTE